MQYTGKWVLLLLSTGHDAIPFKGDYGVTGQKTHN